MAAGRVRPVTGDAVSSVHLLPDASLDAAALLARSGEPGTTTCVFYDAAAIGGHCRIHAALDHASLPLACRQFPRVSVIDPRGVSVTLSHYCPTAAALLDSDIVGDPMIRVDAPAFPHSGEYVGLDATRAWPPLVKPDLLMDWDAWWECERLAIELLARDEDRDWRVALSRLQTAVADIQRWSTSAGPLIDRVRAAFAHAERSTTPVTLSPGYVDAVYAAIPTYLRPARFTNSVATTNRATRRFLAAHAFANWSIHSDQGLTGWLRSIEAAAALLEAGAGVRHADLLLRHLMTGPLGSKGSNFP